MLTTTSDLEKMFDELIEEVVWLHCDWSQYKTLFNTSTQRVDILNAAAGIFFHDIQNIYLNNIALRLSRLVDRRKDVISLERFFQDLKRHNDSTQLKLISPTLEKIRQMSKPFEEHRSCAVAHRSKAIAFGNETLSGFTYKMVEEILAEICTFMNLFSIEVRKTELGFDLLGMHAGAQALIIALKKAILYDEMVSNGQLSANHFRECHIRDA